ncbi:MAG TPA: four helix bundle protein [Bacteroidia bacterium]|nr:four helix bundle protein [Bacteroidia bacterium]
MRDDKKNLIVDMTFQFALDVIEFCDLLEEKRKYKMANQLWGSGTSIGANVREAQNAESKSDFIHKMKIACKEADETEYWLLLCKYSKSYPANEKLLSKAVEIIRIISKIISTSKQ